jgi:hypothetical protein
MPDLKRRCLLLILGLALPLTLGCGSSLRKAPEPQTTASLPEPKIWRGRVGAIPSLDARVTKLVFFASGPADIAPFKEPIYRTRFHHSMTKTVYPEIYLDYPPTRQESFFYRNRPFSPEGQDNPNRGPRGSHRTELDHVPPLSRCGDFGNGELAGR